MREIGLLGWATEALVKLDDEVPGILSRVLTAAPARQQAIFAALAAREDVCGFNGEDGLSEIIRHGRAVDILRHAYGNVPTGLLGALERLERPLNHAEDYNRLHGLLAGNNERVAEALRTCGRINRSKLKMLGVLDPRWVHANVLDRLEGSMEAHQFNRAMAFVQTVCSRATDEAVATAIAAMGPTSTLPRLLQRWVRRADRLPENPVPIGDNELLGFTTTRQYLAASRKYRNCLSKKLGEVAAGRMAIAEFRGELLIEFRPLTAGKGWLVWGFHGDRNQPVDNLLSEVAAARCDELGIPRLVENSGSGWDSYRRLTREAEWGWVA